MPAARARGVEGLNAEHRNARIARTLAHRLKALAWWRGVMHCYPCGVVSFAVATRVLGCTATRLSELIEEGRLPCIRGMPGGIDRDRFIPIDALLGAPTPLETGRGIGWNMGREYTRARGHGVNQWAALVDNPQSVGLSPPE